MRKLNLVILYAKKIIEFAYQLITRLKSVPFLTDEIQILKKKWPPAYRSDPKWHTDIVGSRNDFRLTPKIRERTSVTGTFKECFGR